MALPFQNVLRRLWEDPPPALACEFTEDAVAAAGWSSGAVRPAVFASRPLPAGALRPSPLRENIAAPEAVSDAVAAVLDEVTRRARSRRRDIALLLPDMSARVSVLPFEQLPPDPAEVLTLIKFRLKKTVPFDIETAAVSFETRGPEVLAAVTPRAVVRQYETILENLGYQPGFVTLSTLSGLKLMVYGSNPMDGAMLLRRSGRWMTIAAGSAGRLRLMRVSEQVSEGQDELFHDIYSSALFFQDNYGGKVERIFEIGLEARSEALGAQLESELGVRPRPLAVPGGTPEESAFLGIFGLLAEQAGAV